MYGWKKEKEIENKPSNHKFSNDWCTDNKGIREKVISHLQASHFQLFFLHLEMDHEITFGWPLDAFIFNVKWWNEGRFQTVFFLFGYTICLEANFIPYITLSLEIESW